MSTMDRDLHMHDFALGDPGASRYHPVSAIDASVPLDRALRRHGPFDDNAIMDLRVSAHGIHSACGKRYMEMIADRKIQVKPKFRVSSDTISHALNGLALKRD